MRGPHRVESAERETISPDGTRLVPEEERRSSRGSDGSPAARLRLTHRQYESVFGTDAEASAALAKAQRSLRKGKSAERRERVRSALENFITEVKPGNQTALNTRAAPFAQFITRMHRKIHELWAFGFMTGLDSKPGDLPLNNPALVAKLEIVLDGQGNVDRVAVVRSSGLTARPSTSFSAPLPTPPRRRPSFPAMARSTFTGPSTATKKPAAPPAWTTSSSTTAPRLPKRPLHRRGRMLGSYQSFRSTVAG